MLQKLGDGPRRELRRRRRRGRGDAMKLCADAHRAVGPVRRLDAVGPDALAVRAVRVPVRRRLPAGRSTPATSSAKYDVLILPSGARCRGDGGAGGGGGFGGERRTRRAFRPSIRRSARARDDRETTVPALKQFVSDGGTSSPSERRRRSATRSACRSTNALVERTPSGQERALPAEKFYVPGSILQRRRSTTREPVACGHAARASDVFFDNSPVFRLGRDAALKGVKPVAWFDERDAAAQRLGVGPELSRGRWRRSSRRTIGKGKVYLFGPEITFRGAAARDVQVPVQRDLRRRREADAVTVTCS